MASTINASTTAGIQVTGDNSGNLAFQTQSGTYTQTVPNATGTVMVSGNMPAFSAYMGSSFTPTLNVWTKITLNVKDFDTNSCFDNTTNYRFTPTVAGYYQVNTFANAAGAGSNTAAFSLGIYKNGSNYRNSLIYGANGTNTTLATVAIIYMNGSTDYLEIYGMNGSLAGSFNNVYASASLVRAA